MDTVTSEKSNIIEEVATEADIELSPSGANSNSLSAKRRKSGAGILEFTTMRAGQDVTPANYTFRERSDSRLAPGKFDKFT